MRTSKIWLRMLAIGVAGATAVLGMTVPAAHAAGELDQSQTEWNGYSPVMHGSLAAQTFTARASGDLTQLDVMVAQFVGQLGQVTIEIRSVDNGVPGEPVLATGTAPLSAAPMYPAFAWMSIEFPSPAKVEAGRQYAIVASSPAGDAYLWAGFGSDRYPDGEAFESPGGGSWYAVGADLTFRTYVTAAAPSYTLSGFSNPVDMSAPVSKVWNTVKGGRTVPLKFEVFDALTGAEVTDTSVVASFTTTRVACGTGTAGEDPVEVVSTGATSLTYNTAGGYFQQNWRTPTVAGTCFQVTVRTTDGSVIDQAFFEIK